MVISARLSKLVLLLPACALLATQVARAAGSSVSKQPRAAQLQEVIVTATKRPEMLLDVPMAITAITSHQLQREQLVGFSDLETQVPGLSVELTAPGLDRLTLRGENVGGVGSTVATYIDDIPFGSSTALANGAIAAGDFDTWDLARVEVLRGPQGTLYGANSEGGLIRYVTNPPNLHRFSGAFELGDQDVAHGGNGPIYKGMVNIPIGGIAAVRLDGYDTRLPGYIDDPQLHERGVNRGYREGWRGSFLVKPTSDFSVRLTGFGQTLHTDGTPNVDVVGAAGNPLAPPANQLQPLNGNFDQQRFMGEPATFKYGIYSGKLEWDLGWATLTSVTGYGTTTEDQLVDVTSTEVNSGVPFTFGMLMSSVLPGTNSAVAETDDLYVKKISQEVRLVSAQGQTLQWLAGLFYTRESSELAETLPSFVIPTLAPTGLPSLENVSLDALYREWSGYGQIDYHFDPAFDVALGGRWSENKQSESEVTGGLLVTPVQTTGGNSTGTDFLYSIAPRWHVNQETMAYVRVASGYRPGGPNALPPITPAGVPRTYQSDSTVNYELGVKSILLDHRLSLDVDTFLIHWQRIQLFEFVDDFGINANGGTATSKGLEWTFALTPVHGLNFRLTGAYVDAYLTSNAVAAGGLTGNQLPYAPKWSNAIDANYTWTAFGNYNAFTGATWSYIGSRATDFAAIPNIVNNAIIFEPTPRADLGGYNTLDLRAGLDNGRWTFELYCKNLFDTRGITYYTNGGAPDLGGDVTFQYPRTIGAFVELRL